MLNLNVRRDFPIFAAHPGLHYLDSAATTHQPQQVLTAQAEFIRCAYGPVHRSVYDLGEAATAAYEAARQTVADFIHAQASEIIFTKSTTESLNLAAWMEASRLQPGDEIVLSVAEHHSNLLPWQRLAEQRGAKLVWSELRQGAFDLDDFKQKITARTKIVAITHLSNVLGEVLPLEECIAAAHIVGARVVVDAAQSVGRVSINVHALDVDYLAFSGHKLYGPTGIGVLFAKADIIHHAPPLQLGGGMVATVTRQAATWLDGPARFEGGTPPVTQAVGLAAAIDFVNRINLANIWQHESALATYALESLQTLPTVRIFGHGSTAHRAAIIAWQLSSHGSVIHSHDVATIASGRGVAIRAGHHCAQVLMASLGVGELCRASVGVYTTKEDIDALISALEAVNAVFAQGIPKRATVPSL